MLDVHISGPGVGRALEERGHDVLAVDQSQTLRELEDSELFELAKIQDRILITSNVGDFIEEATSWAAAGRSHAGCVMVAYQVSKERYGTLLRQLENLLVDTTQNEWRDRIDWLSAVQ
jgi:predicted nuclease of predicted toxin-antitoxin system